VQALRVCWSTAKTREIRGVCFLNTFNHRITRILSGFAVSI
jgi:hypothetical protein